MSILKKNSKYTTMKRRSLLTGSLLSSILTFVSPVRAALAPSPKKQYEPMSPYEAVEAVYDGFVSPEPDTEFVFDEPSCSSDARDDNRVHCKMISPAGNLHKHHDIWLIFNDTCQYVLNMKILTRTLIVAELTTKEVHNLSSQEEYNVEETLKSSWRQSGRHVVYVKEFHYPDSENRSFETGPVFRANSQYGDDTHVCALARFLSLIS
jgi:hypothetical protein